MDDWRNVKMRTHKTLGVLAVSFLIFSLFSCKPPEKKEETQEERFGAAPAKVFEVRKQRISEKLFYTGLIEAMQTVNITPDIGGKIARIYVEEGDRVAKGRLLAELDTRAIHLQLQQAQAGVAVAEASYKDAERNMDRMERLKAENAVSDQQYEKIKLAYDAADAQLQQARATLNLANHNLDVSLMKAPFSGIIASKNAETGDVINPMMGGFSPNSGVLTLMDFSSVKIEIDVSQRDIGRIHKGQRALLEVSAFPGKVFTGRVARVNMTADPMNRKFKVEVIADNPDLILRPNTFGEITLEISTHEDALVIPQKAVLENKFVFVVQEDNVVQKREVSIGLQNTDMLEVLEGLSEGERVVVEGNFGLEDGIVIEITGVVQ
jgi:RND family efflux transporter MFP subunit